MRGLLALAVAGLLLAAAEGVGAADDGGRTVTIELRVWQDTGHGRDISISARAVDGSWSTLGVTPLPLDDGVRGPWGYGDITLDVPLTDWAAPVSVEVRVWQALLVSELIYISARPAGGSWKTFGTVRLLLDDGLTPSRDLRFGDIALGVVLPDEGVTTLAGRAGFWGYADGRQEGARFGGRPDHDGPGLAVDRDGSVVVADRRNHAIRRIAPDGTVTTIAGGNGAGLRDGSAEDAQFDSPRDVAVATGGAIYVADTGNHRIRAIAPDGQVTTVAGGDRSGAAPSEIRDGRGKEALLDRPTGLALGPLGDLYIIERYTVRRLSPSGWVSTYAGNNGSAWTDGPRLEAQFRSLWQIASDGEGNLYLVDDSRGGVGPRGPVLQIRKIDTAGIVSTIYRDDPPSLGGILAYPSGMAVSPDGGLYLANTGRHQIVRLTDAGELTAVAGTGEEGHLNGPAHLAAFGSPQALAFSSDGTLFVADQDGSVVRRIAPGRGGLAAEPVQLAMSEGLPRVPGVRVSLFAGTAKPGLTDGPAEQAQFLFPKGMALDHSGNVLVADGGNDAIRLISPDGIVSTLAGGNGEGARDGPCDQAQFASPQDVAVAADGAIYVVEVDGDRIRSIDADCVVRTVAGGGISPLGQRGGFRDGPAAEALFRQPSAISFDHAGNLLIADTVNNLIRRLSPDGQVTTIAGPPERADGSAFNPGTRDGYGSDALFALPKGIAVDDGGNILFPDSNEAIRKIDPSGYVSTVVRTPGYREGGALSGFLNEIAVGPEGEIYIADGGFGRVLVLSSDGKLAVVADHRDFQVRGSDPNGLLLAPDGTLYVSHLNGRVIYKITFEGE